MANEYKICAFNKHYLAESELPIGLQNRAFRYGDGFFETMHANGLKTQFIADHYQRIVKAAATLEMHLPDYFSLDFFDKQISGLLSRNKLFQAARVKAVFVRGGAGLYLPDKNATDIFIEAKYLGKGPYEMLHQGLVLGVYNTFSKPNVPYLQIKSLNAQFYILASLYAQRHSFDDVLLVSADNFLIEATSSNMFAIRGNELFTPSLKLGPVEGVMRKQILKIASGLGFLVNDDALLMAEDLHQMDEIFLTNAVSGIRSVIGFQNRRYFKKKSQMLLERLNNQAFS
ncbi:MAG: aminotransferase class IV [Salinivirgaceae bacterium]